MTPLILSMIMTAFPAVESPEAKTPITVTPVVVEQPEDTTQVKPETTLPFKGLRPENLEHDPRQGFHEYCPPCGRG